MSALWIHNHEYYAKNSKYNLFIFLKTYTSKFWTFHFIIFFKMIEKDNLGKKRNTTHGYERDNKEFRK